MTYFEYLDTGRVTSVDLYEGGRTAIVEPSMRNSTTCTTAAVDLPYNAPELISCLENANVNFDAHPIRNDERFGDFWQSNFSDSVDWRAIFPLPSLQQIPGGPGRLQFGNPAPASKWPKRDQR